MSRLIVVLALTICARAASAAEGDTARLEGNPLFPEVRAADPSIALFGGRYYIYASEYTPLLGKAENGFTVWSSSNLRDWKGEGQVFRFADTTWAKSRDWAPGAAARNGKYYLYFSADDQVGVAAADAPTGPFKDPLGRPLVAYQPDLSSIDPMAFVDDDGQAYLYWGAVPATWLEGKVDKIHTHLFVRKLNPDMTSFADEGPQPTVHVDKATGGLHMEGQFAFKRDGVYYLMWSEGNYDSNDDAIAYRVNYATARSPLGPFERAKNNPVLSTHRPENIIGPGHNSVLRLPGTDEWYVVYHAHKGDGDRRVFIDQLFFEPDGSIRKIAPTRAGVRPVPIRVSIDVEGTGPYKAGSDLKIKAATAWESAKVTKVEFFDGPTKLGEDADTPFDFTWPGAPAGFHRLSAKATTDKGETAASAWHDVDVE